MNCLGGTRSPSRERWSVGMRGAAWRRPYRIARRRVVNRSNPPQIAPGRYTEPSGKASTLRAEEAGMTAQAKPVSRPWRRFLRVSVRGLIVLVLLTGGLAAWIMHKVRVQRDLVATIEKDGGIVLYDWQVSTDRRKINRMSRYLERLAGRLGIDYFDEVVEIFLPGRLSDSDLALVGHFSRLERLDWIGSHPAVTDAGLAHLSGITKLEELNLSGTDITDAGLAHLSRLIKLEELNLSGADITDAGLVHLRGMAGLKKLDLSGTWITDAGLVNLSGLTKLETLSLRNTEVGEAGVVYLKNLTNLLSLDLWGTNVHDFGAQELRRAVPRAKVYFTPIMAR
jgi:hypothetical protein